MDKKRKADLKEEPFDNMEGLGYCKSAYEESQVKYLLHYSNEKGFKFEI